jgi:hypothetical protein
MIPRACFSVYFPYAPHVHIHTHTQTHKKKCVWWCGGVEAGRGGGVGRVEAGGHVGVCVCMCVCVCVCLYACEHHSVDNGTLSIENTLYREHILSTPVTHPFMDRLCHV